MLKEEEEKRRKLRELEQLQQQQQQQQQIPVVNSNGASSTELVQQPTNPQIDQDEINRRREMEKVFLILFIRLHSSFPSYFHKYYKMAKG